MEALFGIQGKDFVLLAADRTVSRSIVQMKTQEDKTRQLSETVALAYSGEQGDAVAFAEYIQGNVQYQAVKNEQPLSTQAAANFTRTQLAQSLRSRKPYNVFMMIAGCSPRDGPQLFWLDYLAAMQQMPYAAHGYAAFFCMSLMDRHWRAGMTVEEACDLLRMCMREMKTRFIANAYEYTVKIVDNEGVREIDVKI